MIKERKYNLIIILIFSIVLLVIVDRFITKRFPGYFVSKVKVEINEKWDEDLSSDVMAFIKKGTRTASTQQQEKKEELKIPEPTCTITATPVQNKIIIDGEFSEPDWENAQNMFFFTDYEKEKFPEENTEGKLLYDNANLYIGVVAYESHMNELKSDVRDHDGAVWGDDCIEIFIQPDKGKDIYYHLIANVTGIQYEAKCTYDKNNIKYDTSWYSHWVVKTSKDKDMWFLEASIPFISMGIRTPKDKKVAFNLNRERYAGKRENTCWSKTYGGFHTPSRFGELHFNPSIPLLVKSISFGELRGENSLIARIYSPFDVKLALKLVSISPGEKEYTVSLDVDIKPGEEKNISLNYQTKEIGTYRSALFITDKETDDVIFATDGLPIGIKEDAFIKDWLILGPFPNHGGRKSQDQNIPYEEDADGWLRNIKCIGWGVDFLMDQTGEQNIEPKEGIAGGTRILGAKRQTWKRFSCTSPLVDLTKVFSPHEYILAYAGTYVNSSMDMDVYIRIGSDDGFKLWVNHNLIADEHVHRGSEVDQNVYPIHLNKGDNLILLKIDQDFGGFNFYCRLTDIQGRPLKGVTSLLR